MKKTIQIKELHAELRWGRGKLLRLARRTWCRMAGHRWMKWHYDWPYDIPEHWEDEDPRDPRPNESLLWMRGCHRDCGTIQTAECSLLQRAALPGDTGGLSDNPIRSAVHPVW